MPQLLFSVVKKDLYALFKKGFLAHTVQRLNSLNSHTHVTEGIKYNFKCLHICFSVIPEDLIKCYSHKTHMIVSGTSVFHQGVTEKGSSLSYPVLGDEKY